MRLYHVIVLFVRLLWEMLGDVTRALGGFRQGKLGVGRWGKRVVMLLIVGSWPAFAMNDTDAVVAEGLFPLERNTPLQLCSEKVTVTLYSDRVVVSRNYVIENPSASGLTTHLGSTGLPTWSHPNFDTEAVLRAAHEGTLVLVDGKKQVVKQALGRLVDERTHVVAEERSLEDILACNLTNDGDICGEAWISFPVKFGPNQIRSVELVYSGEVFEPRFVQYVLERLQVYTEKFWHGGPIPEIELSFGIAGVPITEESFRPRGKYAADSRAPSSIEEGLANWRLEGYVPVREPYRYSTRLVHPQAIDFDFIAEAFRNASRFSAPDGPESANPAIDLNRVERAVE